MLMIVEDGFRLDRICAAGAPFNEATIIMAQKLPRYAEDYKVGEVFDLGQIVITRDEIVEFSKTWEPSQFTLTKRTRAHPPTAGLSPAAGM